MKELSETGSTRDAAKSDATSPAKRHVVGWALCPSVHRGNMAGIKPAPQLSTRKNQLPTAARNGEFAASLLPT
jgi:hypothetical protein